MVKADPKHDYYADLELPSTADAETIKKQFRLLAKQYHPDRNPGKEIDVIPKFQAIQAAIEILNDPAQKKRYDSDRAALNNSQNGPAAYSFKKPAKPAAPPPPPPPSQFPPPPKRDPNLNRPFNSRRPASSASAEKFAQFARAAPQPWERTKNEEAAKAEALRNFQNMRPQSQGPPPRVPPRAAPTAPKPPSNAPSPDIPHASGPPPGFPGLSRTNSGRRNGFAPGAAASDEPPASSSAYAHVHRSDRPPPTTASYSYSQNFAKAGMATSPPSQRVRTSNSPLRPSKSSGFEEVQRPGLSRSSSRYATHSGEKTDINSPGLTRSASVRNSPTGQRWDESGPFGTRPQSQQQGAFKVPPPRHRSVSPRGRGGTTGFHVSASETSSSEEEVQHRNNRPKATPRRPQPQTSSTSRTFSSDNDPALTGQYSNSNYNTRIAEDKQYHYPIPEQKTPYQRNHNESTNPVDDITQGLNKSGLHYMHNDGVPHQSSRRPDGSSSEPQSATANPNATFSAADWDGKFANGDNVFRPNESTSRSRSPTKPGKPKLPNRSRADTRNENGNIDESRINSENTTHIPGVRHVPGTADGLNKAAAFQAGKFSAEDWAQRLHGVNNRTTQQNSMRDRTSGSRTSKQQHPYEEVEVEEHLSPVDAQDHGGSGLGPDAMDVDESVPQQAPPMVSPGVGRAAANTASSGGINLNDLKDTTPFKPSAEGLGGLGDLNATLPFPSRAAADLNLHQAPSSGPAAQKLRLPPPPRPVQPPDSANLTQEAWSDYSKRMMRYMDDWNVFNVKMIDHFRVRQQQISLAMYHNWVTAVGDGASADDFDGLDFVGHDSNKPNEANGETATHGKPHKAGYATYMEWLKQDRVCRTWWEVAFDEHTKCMEDLGRVRQLVKSIRDREFGKTA